MSTLPGQLRFGICGLGFMGRTYFAHLREHPHARVVALCDRDPQRRAGDWTASAGNIAFSTPERIDLSGVAVYATWREMIRDPAVDVVAVTLPTPLHVEVTEAALTAGKHVLCEKPMALDLAGCDRMIRAATRAGKTLMIGQCVRFWPQYDLIKRVVEEGRIGPVRFAKLARLSSPPRYSEQNWLLDGRQSGGALLDLHVHDVDFAHYLLGIPDTVYARGRRGLSGEIDHVVATYGYADGRYACLEGSWAYHAPRPFEMAITVRGDDGTLQWSSHAGSAVLLYAGGTAPERLDAGDRNGWQCELDYFLDCVRTGRPVDRCRPESSRTSIALVLLEQQSIETGRLIAVDRATLAT